jgi:hypothetical protein
MFGHTTYLIASAINKLFSEKLKLSQHSFELLNNSRFIKIFRYLKFTIGNVAMKRKILLRYFSKLEAFIKYSDEFSQIESDSGSVTMFDKQCEVEIFLFHNNNALHFRRHIISDI